MEQEGHSRSVYSVACHPDGALIASCGLDCLARVWDCRTGRGILAFSVGLGLGTRIVIVSARIVVGGARIVVVVGPRIVVGARISVGRIAVERVAVGRIAVVRLFVGRNVMGSSLGAGLHAHPCISASVAQLLS